MNANTRRQLRATVRRRQEARAATVRAVLLARNQGATLREIGELVELSTSQVHRLLTTAAAGEDQPRPSD